MAGARRIMFCMGAMVALIGAVVAADQALAHKVGSVVREDGCPEAEYAYPFQSVCQEPAQFDVEYHLVAPYSNALVAKGGLTLGSQPGSPVSFTANASDEGYKFTLTAISSSAGENITLGTAFTITNTETQTKLGWRFSAWHRGVILAFVEDSMATEFQLATACNVPLPCPETTGARCESYFFLSASLTGLTAAGSSSDSDNWIVPAGSDSSGNLPLLLRRVDTNVIRPVVRA